MLPNFIGHNLTHHLNSFMELSISNFPLRFLIMCIKYLYFLKISSDYLTSECSLWRHDDLKYVQVRIRGIFLEGIPKCCSLLIIDVARFTPMTKNLQTLIYIIPRTLELCVLNKMFFIPGVYTLDMFIMQKTLMDLSEPLA